MQYEGYQVPVWKAGEVVPAGTYIRIDNHSYRSITLDQNGPLPASFDGQVALYRAAAKVHRHKMHSSQHSVGETAQRVAS
ncbi:MAG TPA: hypothetical protein VKR06_23535 [Ktedonosporobacter sp.]|nr:hypothetical protein [Ktedonosporobacter sp.]